MPHLADLPICYKEAAALCLAAQRWAPFWTGHHVAMLSDSTLATSIVPRLSCAEPRLMPLLRNMFNLTEQFDFTFEVQHIAGLLTPPLTLSHAFMSPAARNDSETCAVGPVPAAGRSTGTFALI